MNRLTLSKVPNADLICERALRVQTRAAILSVLDANDAAHFTFENIRNCTLIGMEFALTHRPDLDQLQRVDMSQRLLAVKVVPSPIPQVFLQSYQPYLQRSLY